MLSYIEQTLSQICLPIKVFTSNLQSTLDMQLSSLVLLIMAVNNSDSYYRKGNTILSSSKTLFWNANTEGSRQGAIKKPYNVKIYA